MLLASFINVSFGSCAFSFAVPTNELKLCPFLHSLIPNLIVSFQQYLKPICVSLLLTTLVVNPAPLIHLHFNDYMAL